MGAGASSTLVVPQPYSKMNEKDIYQKWLALQDNNTKGEHAIMIKALRDQLRKLQTDRCRNYYTTSRKDMTLADIDSAIKIDLRNLDRGTSKCFYEHNQPYSGKPTSEYIQQLALQGIVPPSEEENELYDRLFKMTPPILYSSSSTSYGIPPTESRYQGGSSRRRKTRTSKRKRKTIRRRK
jgi:hypothetical protein